MFHVFVITILFNVSYLNKDVSNLDYLGSNLSNDTFLKKRETNLHINRC